MFVKLDNALEENEEKRVRNYLRVMCKGLSYLGVWPEVKGELTKIVKTWTYAIIFLFANYVVYMTMEMIDIYLNLDDLNTVVDNLYISGSHIAILPKIIILYSRRKKIDDMLTFLEETMYEHSSAGNNKELRKYEQEQILWAMNRSKFLLITFLSAIFGCDVANLSKPVVRYFMDGEITLPYRAWFPFDVTHVNLQYILGIAYSFSSIFITASLCISFDMLFTTFALHLCIQLRILKNSLRHSSDCVKQFNPDKLDAANHDLKALQKEAEDNIRLCVVHHQKIIEFCASIEYIANELVFIQFFNSLLLISMTFFKIVVTNPSIVEYCSYISFLTCIMVEIFLYCYHANEVIIESSDIDSALYEANWPEASNSFKKSMMIINERSKRPLVLTGGNFFILSLERYVSLIKSAYSVMALLNRMTE